MLEQVMTTLARPVTDREARLGMELIDRLKKVDGLHDDEGEVILAVAVAIYCEHRRLMDDRSALGRIAAAAEQIQRMQQFALRSASQRMGDINAGFEAGKIELTPGGLRERTDS